MRPDVVLLMFGILLIAACESVKYPTSVGQAPKSSDQSAATPKDTNDKVPDPLSHFHVHCYSNAGNFTRIAATAEALKLRPAPDELMIQMATAPENGKGWVVEADPEAETLVVIAASYANTCSLYAAGFDSDEVRKSAKEHFNLFLINRDDIGLTVMEMYVPGGKNKTRSEVAAKGLVGILRAKPGSLLGNGMILSYIPPEVAAAVFE